MNFAEIDKTLFVAAGWAGSRGRATCLAIAAVVVGVAICRPVAAQELDSEMERAVGRMGDAVEAYDKTPVPPSRVDQVALDVHWRVWKRAFSSGHAGIERLRTLARDASSLGHRNLPAHATAVYVMTADRVASGDLSVRQASELYEASHRLAPDLPYPELAYSAHLIEQNPGRLPAVVGAYTRGVQRALSWLDTRLAWELKLTAIVLAAVMVATLFFLLAQLLRYFGIVAYDCARLLPPGFSSNQTVLVVVAIVVVPGLLLRSPLVSILLLLGVLSVAQRINERIVTVTLFGLLAALPTIDARMSDQLTWPDSQAQQLFEAQYLDCTSECISDLQASWLESSDHDPVSAYTLALAQYRQGTPRRLSNVVEVLDDQDDWPQMIRPFAQTLYGATLVAQAKPEKAIAHLDVAHQLSPSSPAASFNLMRAYQMLDDPTAASAALDDALSADREAVRRQFELDRRDVNSFLIVDALPATTFWRRHRQQSAPRHAVISPVWSALSGPHIPLADAPWLGLFGALIALGSLPLYLSGRTSTPCPRCGMARDPTDTSATGEHRYCLPCYHTFVSGASLEYEARSHNERVLGRRERFQDVMRRVLSVLMPGCGHSQAGHGLGGFILSVIFLTGIFILIRPMGIWRPPFELWSDNWAAQKVLGWLLIGTAGLFGAAAAIRGVGSPETDPPGTPSGGRDE